MRILNEMTKSGVIQAYAIGGAVAALFYMEPLETFDLDIFVVVEESSSKLVSLGPVYRYLERRGYRAEKESILIEGIPVQFLVPYNSLTQEALAQAVQKKFASQPVRVFRPEHLMALMAQTGRPKDQIRLQLMLDQAKYNRVRLHAVIRRHGLSVAWARMTGGLRGHGEGLA